MARNRRLVIPLAVFGLVLAAIWATIALQHVKPKLGLDLEGGTSVTFQPVNPAGGPPNKQQVATTLDIIRNRVNSKGVAEAQVATEGGNIVVSIPNVRNPDAVIRAVGTTAQLRFRPMLAQVAPGQPEYTKGEYAKVDCASQTRPSDDPAKNVVLCEVLSGQLGSGAGSTKALLGPSQLGGTDVTNATAELQQQNGVTTNSWQTALSFSGTGATKFQKLTGDLACQPNGDPKRNIAITLDAVIIQSTPPASDVQCHVGIAAGGGAVIQGMTEAQSKELAPLIKTGALPLTLRQIDQNTVSATVGRDSLRSGLIAGAVGLGLVLLYVLLFYRGLGLVVWLGLACSAAMNIGLVFLMGRWIGFTLSLAGIAGLIVAVGISADSYVVFFERLKDEVREGRTLRTSVDHGWSRAFHTLISADTVSLTAAVILYILAIGPVRGFAFTLGLATIIDLFTSWFFTRPAVTLLTRTRLFQEGRFIGIRAVAAPAAPARPATS